MASPVIWGTIVGTFCYMYFVYFCMTWMPAYFVERRHLSLGDMGLYVDPETAVRIPLCRLHLAQSALITLEHLRLVGNGDLRVDDNGEIKTD